MSYTIFTRAWYKENGEPNYDGRKKYVTTVNTEKEARDYCRKNNADRPDSWVKVSRKYEFTAGGI